MGFMFDWARMSGAPASNDLFAVIDVDDKTMDTDGTNKMLEGKYVVTSSDGLVASIAGGGVINLGGNTLTVVDGGSLGLGGNTADLGGDLTTDGAVTVAGATISMGGQSLTIAGSGTLNVGTYSLNVISNGQLDLNGNQLAVTGGPVTLNGEAGGNTIGLTGNGTLNFGTNGALTLSSSGTLNLGGNTLTATSDATLALSGGTITSDGNITVAGTELTIGGETLDIANLPIGTPGSDNQLAVWTGSEVVGSSISQAGLNNLILNSPTADSTLSIHSDGNLTLNGNNLVMTGGGTINLGNQVVSFTGASFTLTGGGEINLGGNTVIFPNGGTIDMNNQVVDFTGTGTIDLGPAGTFTMKPGNFTVSNGGTLDMGGHTATVAKTGTVAMLDDISPVSPFWVTFWFEDASWSLGSTLTTVGAALWLGTEWGAQTVTFKAGFTCTGSGTAHFSLAADGVEFYDKEHFTGGASTEYKETFTWAAPATDVKFTVRMSETSNSIYPWYTMFKVVPQ